MEIMQYNAENIWIQEKGNEVETFSVIQLGTTDYQMMQ